MPPSPLCDRPPVAPSNLAAGGLLLDAVEQLAGRDLQRAGDADDGSESWLADGALESRYLGRVKVAGEAEPLLTEAGRLAMAAHVLAESLLRLHGESIEWSGQ